MHLLPFCTHNVQRPIASNQKCNNKTHEKGGGGGGHRNLLRHQGLGAVPNKVPPSTPVTASRFGLANPSPSGFVQIRLGTILVLVLVLVAALATSLASAPTTPPCLGGLRQGTDSLLVGQESLLLGTKLSH